jgi:hypothetical protein
VMVPRVRLEEEMHGYQLLTLETGWHQIFLEESLKITKVRQKTRH